MTRGKQFMLALLSLVVIALVVLGGLGAQGFLLAVNPKSNHTNFRIDMASSSIEVAEKAVSMLEEKQSPDALKIAQEAVNKLSDSKDKKSLLARVSVVETMMKNKEIIAEAERAVAYLEGYSDLSNIYLAQEVVAKVTDPDLKRALEERIRMVQENLENQERQQAASNFQPSMEIPSSSENYDKQSEETDVPMDPALPNDQPPVNPEPIAPPFPSLESAE